MQISYLNQRIKIKPSYAYSGSNQTKAYATTNAF